MSLEVSASPVPLRIDEDGVARIGQTRVTLDTVVVAFREGATAEEIVQQYPSLRLADVYSVIAYFLDHQVDVETYLQEREVHSAETQRENESRFDPRGVRERLLSRGQRKDEHS